MATRKSFPASEIAEAFQRLASAIAARHRTTPALVLLGIARGGVPVCERLAAALAAGLGRPIPHGTINVAFHRDDIGLNPIPAVGHSTEIPAGVDGATVILVDDVLFSGRTVRAALGELFSFGRPSRVELAVLVDRGNRRLPIAPDYVGLSETTLPEERVRVALDPADPARDTVTILASP